MEDAVSQLEVHVPAPRHTSVVHVGFQQNAGLVAHSMTNQGSTRTFGDSELNDDIAVDDHVQGNVDVDPTPVRARNPVLLIKTNGLFQDSGLGTNIVILVNGEAKRTRPISSACDSLEGDLLESLAVGNAQNLTKESAYAYMSVCTGTAFGDHHVLYVGVLSRIANSRVIGDCLILGLKESKICDVNRQTRSKCRAVHGLKEVKANVLEGRAVKCAVFSILNGLEVKDSQMPLAVTRDGVLEHTVVVRGFNLGGMHVELHTYVLRLSTVLHHSVAGIGHTIRILDRIEAGVCTQRGVCVIAFLTGLTYLVSSRR